MAFYAYQEQLENFAEIGTASQLNGRTSSYFTTDKMNILSLTKNQKVVADAPSGHYWSENFLNDKFINCNATASCKGCRPKFSTYHEFTQDGTYTIQVTGGVNNRKLVVNFGGSNTEITPLANQTIGFCYALIQAAGGNGSACWVGGNPGGGGGSGASGIFLIRVSIETPLNIVLGSPCSIGGPYEKYYKLNVGGNASTPNGGEGGSYEGINTGYNTPFWALGLANGANGGNKSNGSTVIQMSTSDSVPTTFKTYPGIAGTVGSWNGAGGAGSSVGNGGNGGGGNGLDGGKGAGGGGGSTHFTTTRYGGSGGSAVLRIYY